MEGRRQNTWTWEGWASRGLGSPTWFSQALVGAGRALESIWDVSPSHYSDRKTGLEKRRGLTSKNDISHGKNPEKLEGQTDSSEHP